MRTAARLGTLVIVVAAVLAFGSLSASGREPQAGARQRAPTPPAAVLPPVTQTCPMHPDVVQSRPGECPVCKMRLVPVRLDSAWMCPIHPVVTESKPGACRICRRDLIQVTVALTFTCRGEPEHLEPGLCADGSPRITKRALRPHGNHNPQHGGQFFMAPDNWHHLEGTYPRDRVFRLYVYDDYARPLPAATMRRLQGRIVTKETFDPATRSWKEERAFPLRASRDGAYLEARLDAVTLPAEMSAKVRIKPDAPEYRFDFTFTGVTTDPAEAAARRPAPVVRPATPAPSTPEPAPSPESRAPSPESRAPSPEDPLAQLPVPETLPEILAQLQVRNTHIAELIRRGDFGAVWVPAFGAKDLAVALEPHAASLPAARRQTVEPALGEIVRLAWLLDALGDTGNRQQLTDAYTAFAATIADVLAGFAR